MPSIIAAAAALLAGLASSGTASPGDPGGAQPVRLDVVDQTEGVVLKVIGASEREVDARYTLRVDAAGTGGVNQTSQGGSVKLVPGRQVTMIDLSVASGAGATWTAVLDVTCGDGRSYRIERHSVARG